MTTEKSISCIIIDDESIAREIIETHLSKIPGIKIIGSHNNAIDALNGLRNHPVDLVFLDINMPEISGISFAKSIDKNIKIIFTTAYREYALEGFELQAVDYLLKPISYARLLKAVNNYFERYQDINFNGLKYPTNTDFIFVRADRRMVKISFDDIIYIESFSDYLKIHCNTNTIITRQTISAIEAKLPINKFLRIHRSYIVALKSISSFTNEELIINNKALSISRSYKKEVLSILNNF